jgi:hypothetical protein
MRSSVKLQNQHRQRWILIAAIAIGVALVLMMVPHTDSGNAGAWAAILPLLFVGVISPLSLLPRLAFEYVGRTPDAPVLPASFQRPPPFPLA